MGYLLFFGLEISFTFINIAKIKTEIIDIIIAEI